MNRIFLFLWLIMPVALSAQTDTMRIEIQQGEYWWGGLSNDGYNMPYSDKSGFSVDLYGYNQANQSQPFLVSSKGRYLWSEQPFRYTFGQGAIKIDNTHSAIILGHGDGTLRGAYNLAATRFFPSDGRIPDSMLFCQPQYNTWIELMYDQTQEGVLNYAKSIIENGYPTGVIMIDDNWQEDYGNWKFSKRRFHDPKKMIAELHEMGFKVMVWICPFVSPDSQVGRQLTQDKMLFLDSDLTQKMDWVLSDAKPAIIRWWNGASYMLDLSNDTTRAWFKKQMDILVEEYGVDGFKFDAGDPNYYTGNIVASKNLNPNEHCIEFAKLGLDYPLNEYRASWKCAGLPLVQRLSDKDHSWGALRTLVPNIIAQGLMGYAYVCPDMIGGGQYTSFLNAETLDQELIVRSTQVHALMPMMQFSAAPWRLLSETDNEICRDMAILHTKFAPLFIRLAKESSVNGLPIVRPMCWNNPGMEQVKDQFMVGDELLVAPVVENGVRSRSITLPKGKWRGDDGSVVSGGRTITIDVPLSRLPYYQKIK